MNWIFIIDDWMGDGVIDAWEARESCISALHDPINFNMEQLGAKMRKSETAGPNCTEQFIHGSELFFAAVAKQVDDHAKEIMYDLESFVALRQDVVAVKLCFALIKFAAGIDLPDEVMSHPVVKALEEAVNDHVAWNDTVKIMLRWPTKQPRLLQVPEHVNLSPTKPKTPDQLQVMRWQEAQKYKKSAAGTVARIDTEETFDSSDMEIETPAEFTRWYKAKKALNDLAQTLHGLTDRLPTGMVFDISFPCQSLQSQLCIIELLVLLVFIGTVRDFTLSVFLSKVLVFYGEIQFIKMSWSHLLIIPHQSNHFLDERSVHIIVYVSLPLQKPNLPAVLNHFEWFASLQQFDVAKQLDAL
ncbi:hypothetical protein BDR03DRAFT_1025902 [Suillus americanus]|nr:hypothetical protein BDR03DRAFT_1025902 [Suillus americanus]